MDHELNGEANPAVADRSDPDTGCHRGTGDREFFPTGHALKRVLKTGGGPGGEQLLRVRAGHLGRNGQIHIHLAVRRPGMARTTADDGSFGGVKNSNWCRD
jgi:hypothetical protein